MALNQVFHLTIEDPPPSVNAMTTVTRGRKIKSNEGRGWHDAAVYELKDQIGMPGELVIEKGVSVYRPYPCYWRVDILIPSSKTKCDLDNLLKGILDALGAAGKTPDDRYLVDLRIRFHGGLPVKIAIKQEDLSTWAKIKKTSTSLTRKLAKYSQSTPPLL